jgi:hypothetical protein
MVEFDKISKNQIKGLLNLHNITLTSNNLEDLNKICNNNDLTPCVLSEFMFRNRFKKLDDSNYIDLFEKYLKEIDNSLHKKGSSMHS